MKISVITPCFNSGLTIEQTLSSISHQHLDQNQLEHILIDGGSTDNTTQIITQFPHVHTLISEPDQGIYDAMNKGIRLATGDVIGILNSDDVYAHPHVLHTVLELFKNSTVDSVYGDLNYINRQHKIIRRWRSGAYQKDAFLAGWMPPHPTFFIRKEHYLKYGLYNTTFSISADYELMLRMLYKHQLSCTYIPEVLVHMRTGGHSNNSWRKRWIANQEDRKAWSINELKPEVLTLWRKPIQKIIQYL